MKEKLEVLITQKGAKEASQQQSDYKKALAGTAKQLAKTLVSVYALKKGYDLINQSIKNYREEFKLTAQTNAIIRATGQAAGFTTEKIVKMADELQDLTGISDTVIMTAQNMMLTFRQVQGEVFERSIGLLADMSTLFGSVQAAAIQVGKALNDPITGLTALRRVGITFTETQQNMIKRFQETNQIAKAQNIILDELENQFGGTAKAMALNSDKLKASVVDVSKMIGGFFEPIVQAAAGDLLVLTKKILALNDAMDDNSDTVKNLSSYYKEFDRSESIRAIELQFSDMLFSLGKTEEEINTILRGSDEDRKKLDDARISYWESYKNITSDFYDFQLSQTEEYIQRLIELGISEIEAEAIKNDMLKKIYEDRFDITSRALPSVNFEPGQMPELNLDVPDAQPVDDYFEHWTDGYKRIAVQQAKLESELNGFINDIKAGTSVWESFGNMAVKILQEILVKQLAVRLAGVLPGGSFAGMFGNLLFGSDGGAGGGGHILGGSITNYGNGNVNVRPHKKAMFGSDFFIPPGYPNDTYIMGLTSGEHAEITPAGESGGLSKKMDSMISILRSMNSNRGNQASGSQVISVNIDGETFIKQIVKPIENRLIKQNVNFEDYRQ